MYNGIENIELARLSSICMFHIKQKKIDYIPIVDIQLKYYIEQN